MEKRRPESRLVDMRAVQKDGPFQQGQGHRQQLAELPRPVRRNFGVAALDLSEHQVLRTLVAELPLALAAVDRRGHVVLWNPAAQRLLGWAEEEVLGRLPPSVAPGHARDFLRGLGRSIATGEGINELETVRQHKDRHSIPVLLSTATLRGPDGTVTGVLEAYQDLSARKSVESQLRRQAQRDQLTGLYNRRGFLKRLQKGIDIHGSPWNQATIMSCAKLATGAPIGG